MVSTCTTPSLDRPALSRGRNRRLPNPCGNTRKREFSLTGHDGENSAAEDPTAEDPAAEHPAEEDLAEEDPTAEDLAEEDPTAEDPTA